MLDSRRWRESRLFREVADNSMTIMTKERYSQVAEKQTGELIENGRILKKGKSIRPCRSLPLGILSPSVVSFHPQDKKRLTSCLKYYSYLSISLSDWSRPFMFLRNLFYAPHTGPVSYLFFFLVVVVPYSIGTPKISHIRLYEIIFAI